MLDHICIECDHIEKKIFKGFERQMVKELSITRRNITDYRKILQSHKNVLKKLTSALQESALFLIQKTDYYYNDLLDYIKEIWDILEGLKERIEALQETNESLITFRLNDIMKFLTIISVTLLPLSVIAQLFGMNTEYLPFNDLKYGFWIIVGLCILVVILMIAFFRKRRWFS
jgi:magnesium transporter